MFPRANNSFNVPEHIQKARGSLRANAGQPLKNVYLEFTLPTRTLAVSRKRSRWHTAYLLAGIEQEVRTLPSISCPQQRYSENNRYSDESALNGFTAHLAGSELFRSAFKDQGTSYRTRSESGCLLKQSLTFDRFGEVSKRLTLNNEPTIDLIIPDRETLDCNDYAICFLQGLRDLGTRFTVIDKDVSEGRQMWLFGHEATKAIQRIWKESQCSGPFHILASVKRTPTV